MLHGITGSSTRDRGSFEVQGGVMGSSIRDRGDFVVQGGVLAADPCDGHFRGSPARNPQHRLTGPRPTASWPGLPGSPRRSCAHRRPSPHRQPCWPLSSPSAAHSLVVLVGTPGPEAVRVTKGLGGVPVMFNISAWEARRLSVSLCHSFTLSFIQQMK